MKMKKNKYRDKDKEADKRLKYRQLIIIVEKHDQQH